MHHVYKNLRFILQYLLGKNNKHDTFRPIHAPTDGHTVLEEYVWLDLNDHYLNQWEKFCLRRRIEDGDYEPHIADDTNSDLERVITNDTREVSLLSTYLLKGK